MYTLKKNNKSEIKTLLKMNYASKTLAYKFKCNKYKSYV